MTVRGIGWAARSVLAPVRFGLPRNSHPHFLESRIERTRSITAAHFFARRAYPESREDDSADLSPSRLPPGSPSVERNFRIASFASEGHSIAEKMFHRNVSQTEGYGECRSRSIRLVIAASLLRGTHPSFAERTRSEAETRLSARFGRGYGIRRAASTKAGRGRSETSLSPESGATSF
jgi:hypothetical protein